MSDTSLGARRPRTWLTGGPETVWHALEGDVSDATAKAVPARLGDRRASRKSQSGGALPRVRHQSADRVQVDRPLDRKSTRLNSSHMSISYAVFCLKKKIEHGRRAA